MVELSFLDDVKIPGINSEFLFSWYSQVCEVETKILGDVSVVLCSDDFILQMNRDYLAHDYYTDIITFDYCEGEVVSGDLFISVDTVRSNCEQYCTEFLDELHRVCVHGVLHLCGYKDKSDTEELLMRQKEDEMLLLRKFHVEHLKDV